MKATKLILTIAFFVFSTMVFAQTARPDYNEPAPAPNLSVEIPLKIAMEKPALLKAMQEQLDPRFLKENDLRIYKVKVDYCNAVIIVWGNRATWLYFFRLSHYDPSGTAG